MISFLLRRLLQSVLTVLGVLTATFFLVRLSGDPTTLLLPVEASTRRRRQLSHRVWLGPVLAGAVCEIPCERA